MKSAGPDQAGNDIERAGVKDPGDRPGVAPPPSPPPAHPGAYRGPTALSRHLRNLISGAVALSVLVTALHLVLVFLHVAPGNLVSQRYERQINSWVFPLFEQNWRLFAPNPESVDRQISVRTRHISPEGDAVVSRWFDLTALDNEAVRHHIAPSHTAQNTLRRAWTSYVEMHGTSDESHSERALMMREYLRNIAAGRVAAERGGAFRALQLRVVTRPIPGPAGPDGAPSARRTAETRTLPWWKVENNAR
jgi:hypothetical protein